MKNHRIFAYLLTFLLLLGLLSGCSSAPSTGVMGGNAAADKAPAEDVLTGGSQNSGSSGVVTDRKLIRRITMRAETRDMDSLLSQLNQRIAELEGYVESREIHSGSAYSADSGTRRASLVIRIPADKLDSFLEHVTGISNITYTSEDSDDVTLEYVATESHLKVLRAEEERLLEFLSQAKNVTEMLEIEARLTDLRKELETITSQLKTYDNLVDYGTVTLSITQVQELTVAPVEEPSLWTQISTGFAESMDNMLRSMKAMLVFCVTKIPYLIPAAVVGVIVLIAVRLTTKLKYCSWRSLLRGWKKPPKEKT